VDKINQHIEKMLSYHDYVVVPQLGGFVVQKQSAVIHADRITPPFSTIGFNPLMKHADGLLAIEIARTEGITYRKAVELIESEVDTIKSRLTHTGIFKIENLGTIFKNETGNIQFTPVEKINILKNKVYSISIENQSIEFDYVVAAADYHHVEQSLLEKAHRQYSERYWEKRAMAPGSLIFYIGLDIKAPNLLHHSLFFDADFEAHADDIYVHKKWPEDPLFYVCACSKTDTGVAPEGGENIFILMPIAAGIEDKEELREKYFDIIMSRMTNKCGMDLRPHVIYKRSYCTDNFIADYNSFKGNAYGLSNILRQTSLLKPRIRHKKIKNLFYAGQLSHPGPGLPPSMISGEIAAQLIHEKIKANES